MASLPLPIQEENYQPDDTPEPTCVVLRIASACRTCVCHICPDGTPSYEIRTKNARNAYECTALL